jgi:hypothetical protein
MHREKKRGSVRDGDAAGDDDLDEQWKMKRKRQRRMRRMKTERRKEERNNEVSLLS